MLPGLEVAELPADAVEVGRINDAWGIKGWFKVLPYSADPEALFSSKRWFLLPAEKGAKTFIGVATLAIKEAKVHSDAVVASAHEVDDRSSAELCVVLEYLSPGPAFQRLKKTSSTGST